MSIKYWLCCAVLMFPLVLRAHDGDCKYALAQNDSYVMASKEYQEGVQGCAIWQGTDIFDECVAEHNTAFKKKLECIKKATFHQILIKKMSLVKLRKTHLNNIKHCADLFKDNPGSISACKDYENQLFDELVKYHTALSSKRRF